MKIYRNDLQIVSLERIKEVTYNGSSVCVVYINNDVMHIRADKEEAAAIIDKIEKVLSED